MQSSLRILTVTILSATLLAGCGRKKTEQAQIEPSAESNAATSQSTPTTAPVSDDEFLATTENAPGQAPVAISSDSPVATMPPGVSPELASSDQVYEAWFRKYGLDLNDPTMLDADPDGDGVNNRDEFMADTHPGDAKSRPAATATGSVAKVGLKLKQYNEVKLPVVLESVEGGTARIKHLDGEEKVETVREGQTIASLGLKVEKVQSRRMTDKHGSPVDASRVTLEDPSTQEKTTLVKDMPARSASSHAVLTSEDGETSITIRQGETFSWPKEDGASFKVIDLRADQVVLQDEATGKMWTVMK